MRFFPHDVTRSAAVLCAAALAACSVSSDPISSGSEQRLKERSVAGEKVGFQPLPGGQKFRLQVFRAQLPRQVVVVPMSRGIASLPTVTMRLNGVRDIPVVVDTGAQMSVVEASVAIETKADVFAPGDGMLRVAGVGGEEKAYLARFDTARLGSLEFTDFVSVLRRETSAMRFGGVRVGGFDVNLLGSPVLIAFSYVTFDYPSSRLVLSGGTPFNPPPRAVRVPLEVRESLPYVPLTIGGRTLQAMVDTGARDQIFLNDEVIRELGLEAQARNGRTFKAAGLGGMVRGRQFRIPSASIGDMPVENVIVDTSPGPWRARIGTELLERWRTTFDFAGRALWLEFPVR